MTDDPSTPSNERSRGPGAAGYPRRTPTRDPNRFLIRREQLPAGFAERLDATGLPVVATRPAATVVLVRPAETGPEALLLRRHNRSGFAADAWVFPGGVVDDGDLDPALAVLCDGPSPDEWAARLGLADPAEAFGYAAAALREAFEETGILLARRTVTSAAPGREPLPAESLSHYRAALLDGRLGLREMAAEAGLQFTLDQLTYIAHWITPEPEPRRYDTRFFLSSVPPGAEVDLHEHELVEARWLRPADAVEGFVAGELSMLPPTVHTLRRLAAFDGIGEMRSGLEHEPVPAILPRMRRHPDGIELVVPTD